MKVNITLTNRIVIAFTIQTFIVALLAFSTIHLYVDYIEETVLYEHFDKYLDAYVSELDNGKVPVVPVDMSIFNRQTQKVPEYARELGPGSHEIILDNGLAYHVLNKQFENRVFTLINDETEFEATEKKINILTVFILLLLSLVSFFFSRSLAKRVIKPVQVLANKIPYLTVDNYNELKLDYSDDEIGVFVKAIYDYVNTLNQYLQREKWFTGDISHELRTPMMVISSSVDLLKLSSTTDEQKQEIYRKIDKAVHNVNELINTFLLLARKKSESADEYEITDLSDIVFSVIENMKPLVGEKDIRFKVETEEATSISLNSTLFEIVMTNLIRNAITNIEQGEITVSLKHDCVVVKDTGKGIPDIVKHFVNGNEIHIIPKNSNHLGLGLSIVKRVCEREGWSIIVYNADEGGACFMIKF